MRTASSELPSILIFVTGGAISMHNAGRGLEPDPSFLEVLEQRGNEISRPHGYRARVNQLQPAIDSANADEGTAPKIGRAVRARVMTMRPRGVVVVHGTDTLSFTASRLAFELSDLGVPVVMTGSKIPHGEPASDAYDNIRLAIRTAMQASPTAPVSVAFGGKVLPAVRVSQVDAEGLTVFHADRPLGASPTGIPTLNDVPAGVPQVDSGIVRASHARVISFRFTPAVTARDLLASIGGDPDGLILETFGPGSAPIMKPGVPDALREIAKRMPVIAITQSSRGSVNADHGSAVRQLASLGVISGTDLTLEAAIAKLSYLLDRGFSHAQIAKLVAQNFVGECTPATTSS